MMDVSANIAATVKRRRAELRMSLDEVAAKCGSSKSRIWQLEKGRGNPTISTALSLCSALSISLNDLLGMDVAQPIFTEDEVALIVPDAAAAPVKEAVTIEQLADAFDCVWNAAIGEAHNRQEGMAFAAILSESFRAMSARLRELAGGRDDG